jgi:hypothetical protein
MRRALCLALVLLPTAAGAAPRPLTVVAAGDIACDPTDPAFQGGAGTAELCRMRATSDLALALDPAAVLVLGDNQYWSGTLATYLASYEPTWGRLRSRTLPIPGNHEYLTPGASGYYSYFGAGAGDPATGWRSWTLGPATDGGPAWRALGLNSNCAVVGGCDEGSPQLDWLRAELAAHPGRCTLAFWHHPRFSSGLHGNNAITEDLWSALHEAEADLVLVGHDHHYERFAPQDATGVAHPRGPRELVVGTGGSRLYAIHQVKANSEVRITGAYGILALTLHGRGYEWRFLPLDGGPGDRGAALCHAAWPEATTWHPLPRCRAVSTRQAAAAGAGEALADGSARDFPIAGTCGVPADAVAITGEVKALAASRRGHFTVHPAGSAPPATPTLDFWKRGVFAVPVLLLVGEGGELTVTTTVAAHGSAHLIVDVTGYFR